MESSSSNSTDTMKRMKWTQEHDLVLLREMLLYEPWNYKYASKERGQCWDRISEALNQMKDVTFKVTQRSVQDRYAILEKAFKRKRNSEEKASGICPEESETDIAIRDILERFEDAAAVHKEASDKAKKELESEAAKAEEMRRRSLETFSETRKRGSEDDFTPPSKKRNTGSETFNFLREKAEFDNEIRKRDVELREEDIKLRREEVSNNREASRNHMMFLQENLRLQQEESRRNSQIMLQMQQQQSQMFYTLMNMVNKNDQ